MVVNRETRTYYRGTFIVAEQAISDGGLITIDIRLLIDGREVQLSGEEQLRKIAQECTFVADAVFPKPAVSKVNGSVRALQSSGA